MTDFKSEFTFNLDTSIKYHDGGQLAESYELLLKAPSNKQRRESAKLKQGFFRALKGMADNSGNVGSESAGKDTSISGSEVMSVIMMSDVDLAEYQENFRALLLNDACSVNSIKLTSPMFDSLSDSDTERLMGEYIANFLLASHLSKMAAK